MPAIHHRRAVGAFAMAALLLLTVAAPAAAKKNPPGNNGTVKVDRVEFDDHPNNEPHVGCTFQVDFYGFDAHPSYHATVIFELQPPTAKAHTLEVTGGDLNPFIGEDDNSGGGSEAGLDASETYTLAFTGSPHPQQGYHVKLTVHAPGSQGADTKHKVFWVRGCDGVAEEPPPNSPPGGNPPSTPPSNPPGNPPSNQPGGNPPSNPPGGNPPREDTAGSGGGPRPILLPDTATEPPTAAPWVILLGVVLLVGAPATCALARVRRSGRH